MVIETDTMNPTYSTPKFSIVASGNNSSLAFLAQSSSYKIECSDEFLTIAGVQAILRCFTHGDDEDVAIVAIECKVSVVDY